MNQLLADEGNCQEYNPLFVLIRIVTHAYAHSVGLRFLTNKLWVPLVLRRERGLTKVEGLGSIDEEDCVDSQQDSNGNAEAVELANSEGAQGKEEGHNLKNSPASNETRIKLLHGSGRAKGMLWLCRAVATSRPVAGVLAGVLAGWKL